jgi:hypothetical protein
MKDPYPGNVGIKIDQAFLNHSEQDWKDVMETVGSIQKWKEGQDKFYIHCEIMRYREGFDGRLFYTAVIPDPDKDDWQKSQLVEDLLHEAFMFEDRPYTSDMFLTNAFRHDIRILDDIFPDAWKSLFSAQHWITLRSRYLLSFFL